MTLTTHPLTAAQRLKFGLLAKGLAITAEAQAYIDEMNGGRPMTPADYASTSGVILLLDGDVWVNAPVAAYNPNFVVAPRYELRFEDAHLIVRGDDLEVTAGFWLPPAYHGSVNDRGEAFNSYAFTHADRVRISPIEGCAITCLFCDLPYEFRYRRKTVAGLMDSIRVAVSDPIQPAAHVLISGGTPRPEDFDYLHEVYTATRHCFPDVPADIMMIPLPGLLDIEQLHQIGINELSVNIELFNPDFARRMMPKKHAQTVEYYLSFLARAAEVFGPGRVRSMLLVGLEPLEDTLRGVAAIAERGCVPVLSPFRPDPSTPLRATAPPTSTLLEEAYLRAAEIALAHGQPLGPRCIPCSHNTLTLASDDASGANHHYGHPRLV